MQMTFRWFGKEKDTVTLEQIKQIPNVVGVVPALHDLPAGEAWTMDRVQAMYDEITAAGLTMECIESVNVHEDIKIGLPTRDKYIENYKTSIRNLAKVGVKVICYNFMPVFDWTRTDLYMPLEDGSTCLCYDGKQVEGKSPEDMFKEIDDNSNGYAMPGWETERMGEIKELFEKYKGVTADDLWENLKYFLEAIMPVCEECDVKMAIHPDDPPWSISVFRVLSQARTLSKSCSIWCRRSITELHFAQALWVQVRITIWLRLLRLRRIEFILLIFAMFRLIINGLTKPLTKAMQARSICTRL